jgi:pyruvate dehydrogenase phosphatase
MENLEQVRSKFVGLCVGTKLEEAGVYAVTYQPLKSRVNQDRVVTEKWDIGGQSWLFLAVCDGELFLQDSPSYEVMEYLVL